MLPNIPSQIAPLPREFWEFLTEISTDFSPYLMQKSEEFWTEILRVYSCKKIQLFETILQPWELRSFVRETTIYAVDKILQKM